jgi:hypothetical protein
LEGLEARVLSGEANDLVSIFQRFFYRSIEKRVYASVDNERRQRIDDDIPEHESNYDIQIM